MANNQLELNQKNNFIYKMKETIKSNTKSENLELTKFYEEQLSDRDFTITELTTKLKKINEKATLNFSEEEKLIVIFIIYKIFSSNNRNNFKNRTKKMKLNCFKNKIVI